MNGFFDRSPLFRMMAACLGICLLVLLTTSCASPTCPQTTLPPLPMLKPRPVPAWEGRTYRDLLGYTLRLREAAHASEADKAAARAALTAPERP